MNEVISVMAFSVCLSIGVSFLITENTSNSSEQVYQRLVCRYRKYSIEQLREEHAVAKQQKDVIPFTILIISIFVTVIGWLFTNNIAIKIFGDNSVIVFGISVVLVILCLCTFLVKRYSLTEIVAEELLKQKINEINNTSVNKDVTGMQEKKENVGTGDNDVENLREKNAIYALDIFMRYWYDIILFVCPICLILVYLVVYFAVEDIDRFLATDSCPLTLLTFLLILLSIIALSKKYSSIKEEYHKMNKRNTINNQ